MRRSGVLGVVLVAPVLAYSTASGWSLQATPRPGGGLSLYAVSCVSPRACIAVGERNEGPQTGTTLAERWDGTRWSIQRTPSPARHGPGSYLNDVSCSSARFCIAVGVINGYGKVRPPTDPLAERWNGRRWSLMRIPNHAGVDALGGVSCVSMNACMAIGGGNKYALRWNGRRWSLVRLPSSRALLATVSCTSPRACIAVGFRFGDPQDTPLAERWNGKRWSIQSIPTPAGGGSLTGVSCTSGRACTAVGQRGTGRDTQSLAERWNGKRWSIQPTPALHGHGQWGNAMVMVSCPSSSFCTGVGNTNQGSPLAQHWNGRRWSNQPTPRVPHGKYLAALLGVSCPSIQTCTAVGIDTAANTLAERWRR
jgi:hypothetical protein